MFFYKWKKKNKLHPSNVLSNIYYLCDESKVKILKSKACQSLLHSGLFSLQSFFLTDIV